MSVADSVLTLSEVTVRFGSTLALDRLSLTAQRGAVTTVLGRNGAGKTTMIRCCTDVWSPDSGTVQVCGTTPRRACTAGHIGVMQQSAGAWSGIRPMELLRYLAGLYAHPLPVDELAERLGITHFADTAYRRLSGGQQQAVNLAGAIIGRPDLVFLDEPTSGMDPQARRGVWRLIDELRTAGVSVLLTTHSMPEATELSDHVWIVDHGRCLQHGTVAELTADGRDLETVFLDITGVDA